MWLNWQLISVHSITAKKLSEGDQFTERTWRPNNLPSANSTPNYWSTLMRRLLCPGTVLTMYNSQSYSLKQVLLVISILQMVKMRPTDTLLKTSQLASGRNLFQTQTLEFRAYTVIHYCILHLSSLTLLS